MGRSNLSIDVCHCLRAAEIFDSTKTFDLSPTETISSPLNRARARRRPRFARRGKQSSTIKKRRDFPDRARARGRRRPRFCRRGKQSSTSMDEDHTGRGIVLAQPSAKE
jgi:hypothetical protein